MASQTTNRGARAEDFDSFVENNYPTAYRFAFCMSLAHESAAQLTHGAFDHARRLQHDDGSVALDKRWLLETLHHDWVDGGSAVAAHLSAATDKGVAPLLAPKNVAGLDQSLVLRALHAMSEELRLALSLFYFEQLGYGDIAKILNVTPETVLGHLAEAKTVLRHHLDKDRQHPAPFVSPRASSPKGTPGG